jgi:hypothetical protein
VSIPKLRSRSYLPDWLAERRRHAEHAPTMVVETCYPRPGPEGAWEGPGGQHAHPPGNRCGRQRVGDRNEHDPGAQRLSTARRSRVNRQTLLPARGSCLQRGRAAWCGRGFAEPGCPLTHEGPGC